MRLGPRELARLHALGPQFAQLVPDRITRRLVEKGLCTAEEGGALCRITPAGLRALADAAEAGRIDLRNPNPGPNARPMILLGPG